MGYSEFISQNIAPYAASQIGVYNESGQRVGKIELNTFKPEYGERLYRFGLLSDVHNQSDQTAEPTADLQRALEFFNNKESVAFTCICGDITQNGTASELAIYQNNVNTKSPNTPVYTCTGNHDATSSGLNETNWTTYTGCEKNFTFEHQNDIFIFFSMTTWSLGSSGTPYSETDIDWLEEQLEANKDKRCFVFTHLFFPTRAGNLNDIYPTGNWLGGTQLTRIQGLNDTYKNAIWFSGHSHWKWYLQKYQDRANIYKANSCGYSVHVPSCASPIDSDGTTRVSMPLESEGAIVDVYENYIDIRGMDLKNELYLPIATYRLVTGVETIEEIIEWELGGINSSTGQDTESNSPCARSAGYIELDNSKSYYLTIEGPVNDETDPDNSLKDISLCLYNSDKNYLGRATGTLDGSTYYFGECNKLDITENIFGTYSNAVYARFKFYRYDESTVEISVEDGERIALTSSANTTAVETVSMIWENGAIRSSTGAEVDENEGVARTQSITYDSSKTYYLNYDYGKTIRSNGHVGSIACFAYDSSGAFISKVGGNPSYVCDVANTEFPTASFSNYLLEFPENTASFRLRAYGGSETDGWGEFTTAELEKFNKVITITNETLIDSGSEGDDSFTVPDGCTLVTIDDFTVRSGSPTITEGSDGWMTITFSATGQKFWVKTDDMIATTNSVELVSMEYECDQATDGVGFYNVYGYYYLSATDLNYDSTNGLQFNLSDSQFNGTVPLTIRVRRIVLRIS